MPRIPNKNQKAFSRQTDNVVGKIQRYVEDINEWKNWPGRIIDGKLYVRLHGHWIENSEFLSLCPKPTIPNIRLNPNNCDKSKKWMYD